MLAAFIDLYLTCSSTLYIQSPIRIIWPVCVATAVVKSSGTASILLASWSLGGKGAESLTWDN